MERTSDDIVVDLQVLLCLRIALPSWERSMCDDVDSSEVPAN